MQKLKICIILPVHWSFNIGGAEYQAKNLVEHLAESFSRQNVYYLARKIDDNFQPNNYRLIRIVKPHPIRKYGFFLDSFGLLKWLFKIKPDVIYQRVGCAYTGIAAFYANFTKTKMIFHISSIMDVNHDIIRISKPHHFIEAKAFQYGIKKASFIVAQTNDQSDLMFKNYGRCADKIIPNFHPLPCHNSFIKKMPIKIVWIANIKPNKNPELFIRLAKDIDQDNLPVKFIMIGGPSYYDLEYQNKIECQMKGIKNLSYIGKKTISEVNSILETSHILINTSTIEGFPNTFIQAWLRKVPVISLNFNPDNLFQNYRVGFCANSYDNLVKLTKRLINFDIERIELGNNAYHYALHNHSFKNLDRLISLIVQ